MALSRIWRLLPGKHLVITFTVMNVLLILLYKKMAQIYTLDVTMADTNHAEAHISPETYARERTERDLHGEVNNSEALSDANSGPTVTSETQTDASLVAGDFILQPDADCHEEDQFVVYVYSGAGNLQRRALIRQTWGNLSRYEWQTEYKLTLFFVTGSSENSQLMAELRHEADKFKDLLVANFDDSDGNSTLKGLNALSWIRANCDLKRIRFAFKTDDDVFVNVHLLIDYVSGMMEDVTWHFLCLLNRPALKERRRSRSVYCSRLGYGMNNGGLLRVLDGCLQTRVLPEEDYFFTRFCPKKASLGAAIRYKQLCKSGCLLGAEPPNAALSPDRIQNLANLVLVHPLPPEYWHQVSDVIERQYTVRTSAGSVT